MSCHTVEQSDIECLVNRRSRVLVITEVELFKAINRWATKECERQSISSDGEAKRGSFGDEIVNAIRFSLMVTKGVFLCCV